MLVVPTDIRPSTIHGTGVFLLAPVKKGDLIWRFDSRIDRVYSEAELDFLPELMKSFIQTYGCWHEQSGLWMLCGDDARFFNHSEKPTTFSLGSSFHDDIAANDLAIGAELTSDYRAVCDKTRITGKLK